MKTGQTLHRACVTGACIAAGVAAIVASPLHAHHSISRHYDRSETLTLDGVVVDFLLRNPHSRLRMEASTVSRGAELWTLELDDVEDLVEQGIRSDTIRAGDEIVVTGNPARDGSASLFVRTLRRPADGLDYLDD